MGALWSVSHVWWWCQDPNLMNFMMQYMASRAIIGSKSYPKIYSKGVEISLAASRLLCETWILPNKSPDRYRKCLKNILLHLCGIFRHWWVFWNSNCQTLVYFFIQLNEKYKSFTSTELHLWNCFDLFSIAWKTNQNKSTSVISHLWRTCIFRLVES